MSVHDPQELRAFLASARRHMVDDDCLRTDHLLDTARCLYGRDVNDAPGEVLEYLHDFGAVGFCDHCSRYTREACERCMRNELEATG